MIVGTEIRQPIARERADRMRVGPRRLTGRDFRTEAVPPQHTLVRGEHGHLAVSGLKLQGFVGHAAPE